MAKNKKKYFLNLPSIFTSSRDMAKKPKKIFFKFCNIAFFLFSPAAEICKKQKKIFLNFCKIALCGIQNHMAKTKTNILKLSNVALCGIQNRCIREMHTGLFRAFYFHQQLRYGQKTKKNIFEIWQHNIVRIVRQLKKMHTGLFRAFYFHQQLRYGQKTIKIFLNYCNIALCGIQNRCIRAYSKPFIFIRSRDMAKKRKTIFLKFCNRCIRAYSELSIFTSSRDMAKNEKIVFKFGNMTLCAEIWQKQKNIFEIWQHNIVRHLKKMHTGLFRAFYFHQQPRYGQKQKIFLKFCNIALCGN
ncbi:hypothetical protein PUN28_002152 [Cardiocondyla obscurior]|uniref:Uncharacterized protein n=1 Tax=Cardiocondyla obscurior TaxID=286306 RepID=A0AAW2GSW1_9HYME